ncbi:proline-rich protein 2-like [Orcinus orca]|uniref:proline-rich protein 2-like n=1 Tax=Orcinus orca TaxID=9733 RepID=UPI0021126C75|nr:proline-rich protein 2-like [Orcinus orca]
MCQTYCAHRTLWHQRGACAKGQHPARGVPQTPFQNQGPGGPAPAPARSAPGSDRHPRRPLRRPHPGSPPPFLPQQPPPQPSPGTGTVDGGARAPRKPAGERPRRLPPQDPRKDLRPRPRAPGPVRAGRRPLSARGPPTMRTSLRDPLRPGCLPLVRLPGSAVQGVSRSSPPRHPQLLSQTQGPDGRPPPPVAAPHLDSHRSPCGQNGKEMSCPPRGCAKPGRGYEGCGTNRSRRGCREGGGGILHEWARRPLPDPP